MNNSELFNQFEGKEVGKLVWPFFRYKALIPEQIGGIYSFGYIYH